MMTIGIFAKNANVSRETVRHYVELGLIETSKHPDNGYQLFSEKALMRMQFIRGAIITSDLPRSFPRAW